MTTADFNRQFDEYDALMREAQKAGDKNQIESLRIGLELLNKKYGEHLERQNKQRAQYQREYESKKEERERARKREDFKKKASSFYRKLFLVYALVGSIGIIQDVGFAAIIVIPIFVIVSWIIGGWIMWLLGIW